MWIAAGVVGGSAMGDMAAQVALTLRLHRGPGSGWAITALLLANSLPALLCAPLAGRIADRYDSRATLVTCGGLCAALCMALATASASWLVVLLVALVAAVSGVSTTTVGALVPVLAGRAGVVRANSLLRGTVIACGLTGMTLSAAGSSRVGTAPILIADAVTFVGLAVGAAAISARRGGRPPVAPPVGRAAPSLPPRPSERAPSRERLLPWVVTVSYALVLLLVSTTNVAQVFFVKDMLGASDLGYGLIVGCWTAGTLIAVPLIRRVAPEPALLVRVTIAGELVVGLAILGCGMLPTVAVTVVMYVVGGVGACALQIARGSFLQLTAPESRRGRALATYGAVVKVAGVAALGVGGVLLGAVGSRGVFLVAGVGSIVVAVGAGIAATRPGSRQPSGCGGTATAEADVVSLA